MIWLIIIILINIERQMVIDACISCMYSNFPYFWLGVPKIGLDRIHSFIKIWKMIIKLIHSTSKLHKWPIYSIR